MTIKNAMGQGNNLKDNVPELGKEGERAKIIGEAKKGLMGLKMAVLAGGVTAILGVPDPAQAANKTEEYALLADNSGTMLVKKGPELATPEQIKEIAKITKMAPVVVETILSMSEKNRQAILKGELGDNSILRVEAINSINQLVNTGDRIPTKNMFKPLSEANYKEVVAELFNTDDIDEWLRNPDGTPYDADQKKGYRNSQQKIADKYLSKADEFKRDFGQKALDDWFKLYNEGALKLSRQGREFLRRLFTSASSIVFYDNTTDQMRTKTAPAMAAQMGEYLILTGQGKVNIAKIEFGDKERVSFKYLLPSETQIRETGFNIRHDLSDIVIQDLTKNYKGELEIGRKSKETEDSKQRIAATKQDIAATKQDIAATKQDIAATKQDTEKLKKEGLQYKRSSELTEKAGRIGDKIVELIKEFIKNPTNKTLENEINQKIKELRDVKTIAERELPKENLIAILKISDVIESMYIPQFEKLRKQKT